MSPRGWGDPVVFVHSDGGNRHHWDAICELLHDRTTAAFDRRGHGKSEPPRNGSFQSEEGAADIAAVLEHCDFDRVVLVGHSGGAFNAFTFAALHPASVAGLLLVDPPVLPAGMMDKVMKRLQDDYEQTVEAYYRSIAGPDAAVVEHVLADVRATPRKTIIGCLAALSSFDPGPLATNLPRPALSVIQSQFDVEGALHKLPPGFPRVTIDGGGHWIHLAKPDAFGHQLRDFLSSIPPAQISAVA